MPEAKRESPIRQSVRVDCPIEDAFRLFTEEIAAWWPLAPYSIGGDETETCVVEPWSGGRVFERDRSGEEREWGTVLRWDPPERLSFDWHPGGTADANQTVDIEFQADADGTRVTVIHTGWEMPGLAVCGLVAHTEEMWPELLNQFFLLAANEVVAVA